MKPSPVYPEAIDSVPLGSFQLLAKQSLMGIYSIQDNVFTFTNNKFAEIFGYQQTDLLGVKNLQDFVAEHDHTRVANFFSNIEQRIEQDLHLFFQGRKSNGDLIDLETYSALMEFNGKSSIFGTLVDITKQKKAAEHLQQIQKMEAISQLAGGVAHDFNNLLTVINGYSTILIRSLDQESPLHKIAKNILIAGERAVEMTRQLHSFSHRQILEPKSINMDNQIKGFESLLSSIAGDQLQLITSLRSNGSIIKIDNSQFEEIITNLIMHARDASEAGSSVILETAENEPDEAFWLSHPGLTPGDYVMLSVTDFGTGLNDNDKMRIFEPFFKSKTMKRGTGLGLAVVYRIVTQNNGAIDVISQPGQGTTLQIFLPKYSI